MALRCGRGSCTTHDAHVAVLRLPQPSIQLIRLEGAVAAFKVATKRPLVSAVLWSAKLRLGRCASRGRTAAAAPDALGLRERLATRYEERGGHCSHCALPRALPLARRGLDFERRHAEDGGVSSARPLTVVASSAAPGASWRVRARRSNLKSAPSGSNAASCRPRAPQFRVPRRRARRPAAGLS